jgi:hypothetical protein
MENKLLHKKFSIGISFSLMSAEQYVSILRKYNKYINDVYFSPVEDIKYQTRINTYDFSNTTISQRREDLSKVLEFARCNDIKLNLSLNAHNNSAEEQLRLFDFYNSVYQIDSITTFSTLARLIKKQFHFSQIICTYNEGIDNQKKLNQVLKSGLFTDIVLGNSLIRDYSAFQLVNQHKTKVKLLLNNGCLFECKNFCKSKNLCERIFIEQSQLEDIHTMYARQSIFPEEMHAKFLPSNLVDVYKLSTRPISYQKMISLLDSYIEGKSEKYIVSSANNYHLYARLSYFSDYYSNLNYSKVLLEKDIIWSKINL